MKFTVSTGGCLRTSRGFVGTEVRDGVCPPDVRRRAGGRAGVTMDHRPNPRGADVASVGQYHCPLPQQYELREEPRRDEHLEVFPFTSPQQEVLRVDTPLTVLGPVTPLSFSLPRPTPTGARSRVEVAVSR